METASCPILYAPHSNQKRRIGSSHLYCKNPRNHLHSFPLFPLTFIKNVSFRSKNLQFNVSTVFSSSSSSTGDSPHQQLAVLLEVEGVLMDVYRLGNRQAFNIAFRKLGLDCANWTEPVYADLVRRSAGDEERMLMIYFNRIGWPTSVPTSEKGAFVKSVLREKKSALDDLVMSRTLPLRPGVKDFIDDAYKDDIPVVILTSYSKIGENVARSIVEKLGNDMISKIIIIGNAELIVTYVENMLTLESGAIGELVGSTMLVAIVDRLIDLDVEIPWDDILRDDFSKGIFEMELEDLEGPADDPQQDVDERQMWLERIFSGNVVAEKLDSLMVLTFEHLKSSYESGRLHQVFETLLQSFQKTVLTAYKSKFAQFVIFYACSLDPDYCGTRFADALINIFENSAYPEWRMSSVAYLASYLSRSKFISASLVADMLERVVNWCYEYSKNLNEDINPKAHKVYYAGCQAVMYVLCFRMRAMLAVPRLRSKLSLMRIADILRHKLNPLKVCLPSIVDEFLRLAKSTRLFAVPDNPDANGMLESDFSVAFGGPERLDMFFPFDPCLLKKSDRFIRPNFVYWSMVRSTYDHDDEDEDEGSSDEDDAEFSGRVNRMETYDDEILGSVDDDHDLDEFDYSLDKMSITPKNPPTRPSASGLRGGYLQMPSRIRPSTSPESL